MATVNFIRYEKQSGGTLSGVAEYVAQEEKTWEEASRQRLVSGQNCSPQFACREFLATRSVWRKKSQIWFYHYTQSFHPEENMDGATAHQVAQEFAARAWPDSEVLIATHIDRDHIHSHFIVNAVCHETGKMLRQGPKTLDRLREISDELCRAHGLSVLPKQEPKGDGMTGREYRSAAKGESWKFQTMNAIDRCMRQVGSREEFVRAMEHLGYGVRWEPRRQNITYTHPNGKKVRDRRLHDEKYWKEMMEREFELRQEIIARGIEAAQFAARCAAGADRETPDGGGVDRTAGSAQCPVSPDGNAVRLAQEPESQPARLSAERTDTGSAGRGSDPASAGAGAAETGTGWEEERAAFFNSMAEHQSVPPVTGRAVFAADLGRIVGAVVELGSTLERNQSDPYIARPHSDRKALRREREKKIAMGHRPDDREEEQGPNLAL